MLTPIKMLQFVFDQFDADKCLLLFAIFSNMLYYRFL